MRRTVMTRTEIHPSTQRHSVSTILARMKRCAEWDEKKLKVGGDRVQNGMKTTPEM